MSAKYLTEILFWDDKYFADTFLDLKVNAAAGGDSSTAAPWEDMFTSQS